ncbi:RagB/SusD family nutrient uptake outer membrane protein [Bacteroides oleiciplenus]|uniref:RagB/SusD domain-containing protein n=1 Tax=Bacteroides oleiciplenus YIT 12058 TaxID=742727 RepID=K9EKI6_9BACE|nr:RagB/SusD family nutrient uptake outer membrane protein [Bacteroides oleiciplenus]EKU89675.1 hypothetical protein HMPREF9447_03113 [Bacteroides oleiciplenus YIT 12058]
MKRILKDYILFVIYFIALTFTACMDLDVPPKGILTPNTFYETATQADQGIVGIYTRLVDIPVNQYWFMSECRSDNTWVNPTPGGFREYSEIGTFRAGYDLGTFNTVWNLWYRLIYNANAALEKLPNAEFKGDEALRNQFMGEAHFLRGWAYFELVRSFGNVPIIDKVMAPADVLNTKQSTAREIYDKIIVPDLKQAKSLLPLENEMRDGSGNLIGTSGRANHMVARAMLGRVYMTMAGFPLNDPSTQALAEEELNSVITYSEQNGDKYWAPDIDEWRKQWSSEYNNKYSIFAVQHRTGGTGNRVVYQMLPSVPPSFTKISIFVNEIYIEKTLMYEFDKVQKNTGEKDLRGIDFSILTGYEAEANYPAYSNTTDTLNLPDGKVETVQTKSMFYKYFDSLHKRAALGFETNIENTMINFNDWPNNFPVIRLEDIMLMYAEILVSKGQTTEALAIINKIRGRAGADKLTVTSATDVLNAVKNERRLELMCEGVRWFDIVRWGEWKNRISVKFNRYSNPDGTSQSNIQDGRYLYPIPMSQIDVKPGFYKQNTDY